MNEILHQINTIPGMAGSMVCDQRGNLLAHVFSSIADNSMLKSFSIFLTDDFPALLGVTSTVKTFDLRFGDGRIIVKPLHDGFLILLCNSSVNLQELSIAVKVATKNLEDKTAQLALNKPVKIAKMFEIKAQPPQELIEKGELSPSLRGMQTALAKILGPMAKIVFIECVEMWQRSCDPSKSTLPELLNIIATEIDEPKKAASFRQLATAFV